MRIGYFNDDEPRPMRPRKGRPGPATGRCCVIESGGESGRSAGPPVCSGGGITTARRSRLGRLAVRGDRLPRAIHAGCALQQQGAVEAALEGLRAAQRPSAGCAFGSMGLVRRRQMLRINQELATKGSAVHALAPPPRIGGHLDTGWTRRDPQIFRPDDAKCLSVRRLRQGGRLHAQDRGPYHEIDASKSGSWWVSPCPPHASRDEPESLPGAVAGQRAARDSTPTRSIKPTRNDP